MANVTPEEFAAEWAAGLKNKTAKIRRGIERVRDAPGVKAAAKQEKLKNNWNASVDSGKWASNVSSVPVEEWRSKTLNKGLARIAAGVDEALPRMVVVGQQLLDHIDRSKAIIDKIDDTTPEGRENRMVEFSRQMRKLRIRR